MGRGAGRAARGCGEAPCGRQREGHWVERGCERQGHGDTREGAGPSRVECRASWILRWMGSNQRAL